MNIPPYDPTAPFSGKIALDPPESPAARDAKAAAALGTLAAKAKVDVAEVGMKADVANIQTLVKPSMERMERLEKEKAAAFGLMDAAPPEMKTEPRLTLGEGIAGVAAGFLGADTQQVAQSLYKLASDRNQVQFENEMRKYGVTQARATRAYDAIQRKIEAEEDFMRQLGLKQYEVGVQDRRIKDERDFVRERDETQFGQQKEILGRNQDFQSRESLAERGWRSEEAAKERGHDWAKRRTEMVFQGTQNALDRALRREQFQSDKQYRDAGLALEREKWQKQYPMMSAESAAKIAAMSAATDKDLQEIARLKAQGIDPELAAMIAGTKKRMEGLQTSQKTADVNYQKAWAAFERAHNALEAKSKAERVSDPRTQDWPETEAFLKAEQDLIAARDERDAVNQVMEETAGHARALMAQTAATQQGNKYTWGGNTPGEGFDCSGLVKWAADNVGINLGGRTAAAIWESPNNKPVGENEKLKPGDLVFFKDTGGRKGVSHVVMVQGMDANGQPTFVHAGGKKSGVQAMKNLYDYMAAVGEDKFVGIKRPPAPGQR